MHSRNQSILDDDRIGRLLLNLSLPAFFGMFVMTLYNVVDTIFIGHYVGPLGIAGLSIVFPFQMISMGVGHMMGMGGASLISRLIGRNDVHRAEHALGNALTFTIVLSIVITIVGLANTDFWLRLMGASETILPFAHDYMTIILIGTVFRTSAMSLNSLIRAEGNARVPMIGMIMGAVLNIILDAIFIIPLGMGVTGAALATLIAQIVAVLYFTSHYFRGMSFLKVYLKNLIIEWSILRDVLAIGIAAFSMTVAGSLTIVFINRALIIYGGDFAVSAFGIVNRIMMFAMMPGIVIGQALQPVLGFNYGAKRYDRALRVIKIAITAATAWCIPVFLVLCFIPHPLISIFTADSELIALGSYAAKRIFFVLYLIGFIMVGSMIFQATGKVVQSFITSISRSVLFLLPSIFILPRYFQLDGVWLSFPVADVLTFLLVLGLLVPEILEFRRMNELSKNEPEKDEAMVWMEKKNGRLPDGSAN